MVVTPGSERVKGDVLQNSMFFSLTGTGAALHRYRRGHRVQFPYKPDFFQAFFHNCKSCVYNCDDLPSI